MFVIVPLLLTGVNGERSGIHCLDILLDFQTVKCPEFIQIVRFKDLGECELLVIIQHQFRAQILQSIEDRKLGNKKTEERKWYKTAVQGGSRRRINHCFLKQPSKFKSRIRVYYFTQS